VNRADRDAVLSIVGVVNVPIIHYSVLVELAAGAQRDEFGKPTMPASMLVPLLMVLAGFAVFWRRSAGAGAR
jgi:heme exporter protein C